MLEIRKKIRRNIRIRKVHSKLNFHVLILHIVLQAPASLLAGLSGPLAGRITSRGQAGGLATDSSS